MIKSFTFSMLFIMLFISCNKSKEIVQEDETSDIEEIYEEVFNPEEPTKEAEDDVIYDDLYADYPKRLPLDFESHKEILNLILLLPDESFGSWSWSIDDRIAWYTEIEQNNSYVVNIPFFLNQIELSAHKAHFSILDGSWIISLYEANDDSIFIITNNIVGDGNIIHIYEAQNNKLIHSYSQEDIFGNFEELVTLPIQITDCEKILENATLYLYDVDLKDKQIVEFNNSWYHTKEEFGGCLRGNTIQYTFNPNAKSFDITRIYWAPKSN